jgi:carbamoyltransferase
MYILGLNAYHADSSAAIFQDGTLIAATEEERFRRIKHWAGFPEEAVRFCLREAGISLQDVKHISIGRDPYAKLFKKSLFLLKNPVGSSHTVRSRLKNARHVSSLEEEFYHIDPSVSKKNIKAKIHQVEHHRSHLASAFFASPFEESAILSVDGSGDFSTTMTAVGKGNKFKVLNSVDFPHSVGLFYTALTQFLGFPHYGDEYKVMGLAPYGVPRYVNDLREILVFCKYGLFKLNQKYFRSAAQGIISYGDDHIPVVATLFTEALVHKFGPQRISGGELTQYHKDLAASVQKITEELIFHILNHLQHMTGFDNVCIAGGVAQNSVANGKYTSLQPDTMQEYQWVRPCTYTTRSSDTRVQRR